MKKILLILALIASVCTLSSCKNENITKDENKKETAIVDEYQDDKRTGYYGIIIEYNNAPIGVTHTFSNIQTSQDILWFMEDKICSAFVKASTDDYIKVITYHNTIGNTAKFNMYICDEWGNILYDTPLKTIYFSNLPITSFIKNIITSSMTVYFD